MDDRPYYPSGFRRKDILPPESCEKCYRIIGPRECLYEVGRSLVCEQCMERHYDELEVKRESDR